MKKHLVFALALILIMASSAGAAPAVSSVSGSLSEGSSVVVTGSSFGTKSVAAPVKWDNFDNGTNGGRLSSSIWPVQTSQGGSTYPTYSNSVLRAGDKMSCKIAIKAPQYNCSFGYDGTGKRYWYISYWRYDITGTPIVNYKQFRIYGNDPVSGELPQAYYTELVESSAVFGVTDESLSTNAMNEWVGQGAKNKWIREEFYFDMGTRGVADGKATLWVDSAVKVNKPFASPALLAGRTGELASPRIGHYYSTNSPGLTSYFSEAYIDNTQARVEIGDSPSWSNCKHREIQIPSVWSSNSIKITANQGSFLAGQTAYLYVVDASGAVNSQGYPVVIGGGSANAAPTISITSPTSENNFGSSQNTVQLAGTAGDDDGVSNITWSNSRGGSGTAVTNTGDWSNWSTGNISLQEGENIITVTATDTANQAMTDTLTVTYSSTGTVQAWSATAQTGDSSWTNSSVTYCVRLLIEGSKVTQSGNQIKLGFQGRASGNYTIKKVSIAKRDTAGLEGDVVDSTWTKVTFDGKSVSTWATDIITVPAGLEKPSNAIAFPLQAGNDYYVTFKIQTASVKLDPPSTYRELYLYSASHTDDVDWGQNMHFTTQDFHALSRIYVLSKNGTATPIAPKNLKLK